MKRTDTPTKSDSHARIPADDDRPIPKRRMEPKPDTTSASQPSTRVQESSSTGQHGVEYVDPELLTPHPLNKQIYGASEDDGLEASIRAHGILNAIVVTKGDVIISGHRRWETALRLKFREVPIEQRDIENETLAIIEFNRQRKKTDLQLWKEGAALKDEVAAVTQARMVAGTSSDGTAGGRGRKKNPGDNGAEGLSRPDDRRRSVIIARTIGTNRKRWDNLDTVFGSDDVPQELKDGVSNNTVPLSTAVKQVHKLRKLKKQEESWKDRPVPKSLCIPKVVLGDCGFEMGNISGFAAISAQCRGGVVYP